MTKQIDFDYINHIFQLDWYDQERLDFYNRYTDFQNDIYKPNRSVVYSEFGYDWNTSGVCINSKVLFSEMLKRRLTVVIRIAQTRNGFGCSLETIDDAGLSGFLPCWKHCNRPTKWEAVQDLLSHTDDRKVRKVIKNFSSDLRQLSLF